MAISGSSLLLREATVELHKPTNKPSDFPYTLEDIATGASTGLYSFKHGYEFQYIYRLLKK